MKISARNATPRPDRLQPVVGNDLNLGGLLQDGNRPPPPAFPGRFRRRMLPSNRHDDDVGLVGQRQERLAVFGRQTVEIAPLPLLWREVQAEEVGPQLTHQPHEGAEVVGDRLAVKFRQRANYCDPRPLVVVAGVVRYVLPHGSTYSGSPWPCFTAHSAASVRERAPNLP